MSNFEDYAEQVPVQVKKIRLEIVSEMVEDFDGNGDPLGTFTEIEYLEARAVTVDANGKFVDEHIADADRLMSVGVMSAQELLTVRDWIIAFRDSVEAKVLPG